MGRELIETYSELISLWEKKTEAAFREDTKKERAGRIKYWKTFEDFVERACKYYKDYGLTYSLAEAEINKWLKRKSLDKNALLCFINYYDNGQLFQYQIAEKLKISVRTVQRYLEKMRNADPELFKFGVKPGEIEHMRKIEEYEEDTQKMVEMSDSSEHIGWERYNPIAAKF